MGGYNYAHFSRTITLTVAYRAINNKAEKKVFFPLVSAGPATGQPVIKIDIKTLTLSGWKVALTIEWKEKKADVTNMQLSFHTYMQKLHRIAQSCRCGATKEIEF